MKTSRLLFSLLLAVALTGAQAETRRIIPASLSSGTMSNPTDEAQTRLIGKLTVPGATRVRVPLAQAALGLASRVRFTSVADGQSQTLDAAQLEMWARTSALFNGDTVRVEVIVAPGDSGVAVQVEQMFTYSHEADPASANNNCCGGGVERTLCGPDNRVASNDNRVGRLTGGCTGWLISNGGVLTAGHCPLGGGSIFEVNIPASLPNGANVASAVQDQFPIIAGSMTVVNGGVGNDWQVFRIGQNNLLQTAHVLHGFFRMTPAVPAAGSFARVTGCGIDNTPVGSQPGVCGNFDSAGMCTHFGLNAQNQTLQTSTGGFSGLAGSRLLYSVDTEPANSGSPVIWEATGFTIGIHTAGGCTASGGSNSGTSFGLAPLGNAIALVPGPNTRYLDRVRAPDNVEDGTIFQPHDTLVEAVNVVPVGGQISAVKGSYPVTNLTITKAMTISAPVGDATFGN